MEEKRKRGAQSKKEYHAAAVEKNKADGFM